MAQSVLKNKGAPFSCPEEVFLALEPFNLNMLSDRIENCAFLPTLASSSVFCTFVSLTQSRVYFSLSGMNTIGPISFSFSIYYRLLPVLRMTRIVKRSFIMWSDRIETKNILI